MCIYICIYRCIYICKNVYMILCTCVYICTNIVELLLIPPRQVLTNLFPVPLIELCGSPGPVQQSISLGPNIFIYEWIKWNTVSKYCAQRGFFFEAPTAKFWKRDISSVSENVFLGGFWPIFWCWTPLLKKSGVSKHKNSQMRTGPPPSPRVEFHSASSYCRVNYT